MTQNRASPASDKEKRATMSQGRSPKAKPKGKVAVLVLGMHRSGTSMLAGMLERLGCKGPQSVMAPNDVNPKGFFESTALMRLNDEILATLGTRWDDWQAVDPDWQDSPRFIEYRQRIADSLAAEYGQASLIHLKDPRLCRLLPLWRLGLEDAGFTPVCLHTHRNPVDVARSLDLRERAPVAPGTGMLIWLRHVLDAEAASRGLTRVFTSYGGVLADWAAVADRAEAAFGFAWPVQRQARTALVGDIIDPGLRHHATPIETVLNAPTTPAPIREALQVFERWAQSGEDAAGRSVLDRVGQDFAASAALMGAPIVELASRVKQGRQVQSQLDSRTQELAAARAEVATGQEAQREADARLTRLQAETDQAARALQARLATAEAEVATGQEAQREANARLTRLQAETDQAARALQARLATAEAEVAAGQEAQRQADARLTQLRAEADLVAAELQSQLALAQADRAAQDAAQARLAQTLETARRQHEDALQAAGARQQALEDELNGMTAALVDRDRQLIQQRNAISAAEAGQQQGAERLAAMETRLAELEQALNGAKAELHNTRTAGEAALERAHQDYRSSTSWRVSAPVRFIGRLVKHR